MACQYGMETLPGLEITDKMWKINEENIFRKE